MTTNNDALREAIEIAQDGMKLHVETSPEYKVCAALISLVTSNPELQATAKAGGEVVAYLKNYTTAAEYGGYKVTTKDDPNGFPVFRITCPQPFALLDDVVKDAPSPKYIKHIQLVGHDVVVLAPEIYDAIYAAMIKEKMK